MAKVSPIMVQKFLKGIDYPVSKQELIEHARRRGADDSIIGALEEIPLERFNSPNDVAGGMGRQKSA